MRKTQQFRSKKALITYIREYAGEIGGLGRAMKRAARRA
jgi:hypothetical protein